MRGLPFVFVLEYSGRFVKRRSCFSCAMSGSEAPGIAAHIVDVAGGVPVEQLGGAGGVGVAGGDVAGAAGGDAVADLPAAGADRRDGPQAGKERP